MKPKSHFSKEVHTILSAGLLTASIVVAPSAQASTWTGAGGNWSSNASPGWNGTGVPDGVGAVANKASNTTAVTTQDVVGGVTVGTISTLLSPWTLTLTNGITLNQDGAGDEAWCAANQGERQAGWREDRRRWSASTGGLHLGARLHIAQGRRSARVTSNPSPP